MLFSLRVVASLRTGLDTGEKGFVYFFPFLYWVDLRQEECGLVWKL